MDLILPCQSAISENLKELVKKTIEYEKASLSKNTIRSYQSMCRKFQAWCEANGQPFLPTTSDVLSVYISSIADVSSFSTIDSTIAAIEMAHQKLGHKISGDLTFYKRVRKGIRRTHKENQSIKQAKAVNILDLKGICCHIGNGLQQIRDKSILTLAFFGALRRSELSSLNVEHLEFSEKGVSVYILQSKGSDTKQTVYISYAKDKDICPVKSLQEWIKKSEIKEGPLFYSLYKGGKLSKRITGEGVSNIIKKYFGDEYSGHSTRRGLITASAEKGTPLHIIKKHSRHKHPHMVFRYIEDSKGFEDSSVNILGV